VIFSVRKLYDARVADLKEAHEREVAALKISLAQLVEQIEYLRMTGHAPIRIDSPSTVAHKPPMSTPQYMTEEEEDIRHMADEGLMDPEQLKSALAELGIEA
jgi:hypothetical protein